jgi:23S rRNA pseudouridine2605 synthase
MNHKKQPGKLSKSQNRTKPSVSIPDTPKSVRLNKYIAQSGVCSRREADTLIEQGKIRVNDMVITEMGYQVMPGDKVYYEKKLLSKEKLVYVLLNKPKDFITTTDDPQERKTVMNLVATACEERIYPVGRLDRNTTGLLLLTNDGELSKKLTHPSHEVSKVYQVELDMPLSNKHFENIQEGIELEDGPIKIDEIAVLDNTARNLGIEIHSGKNRIVRRIFESLGYEVTRLDRVMFAGLTKKDLPRGKWRFLSEKEIIRLKYLK